MYIFFRRRQTHQFTMLAARRQQNKTTRAIQTRNKTRRDAPSHLAERRESGRATRESPTSCRKRRHAGHARQGTGRALRRRFDELVEAAVVGARERLMATPRHKVAEQARLNRLLCARRPRTHARGRSASSYAGQRAPTSARRQTQPKSKSSQQTAAAAAAEWRRCAVDGCHGARRL